jgi:hypothetical protein
MKSVLTEQTQEDTCFTITLRLVDAVLECLEDSSSIVYVSVCVILLQRFTATLSLLRFIIIYLSLWLCIFSRFKQSNIQNISDGSMMSEITATGGGIFLRQLFHTVVAVFWITDSWKMTSVSIGSFCKCHVRGGNMLFFFFAVGGRSTGRGWHVIFVNFENGTRF